MRELTGALMRYAWGSPTRLPTLLGTPGDGEPWAELWFGTHPRGPSRIGGPTGAPLVEVAGELPFLAKFLAAAEPLSLQVHPTAEQAEAGFAEEERAGVPLDADRRTFRDPRAKPEVIIAVDAFHALCGFRPVAEAAAELREHGAQDLAELLLERGPGRTVTTLLAERPPVRLDHPLFARLDAAYPGDPGAVVALLLNRVELAPGEGIFLPAGQLHMYLDGLGVEVMGASDNVVRGGLTVKHVDLPRLAEVMSPDPYTPPVLRPDPDGWYPLGTEVFAVQRLRGHVRSTATGPEVVLVVEPGDGPLPAGVAAYVAPGEAVDLDVGLAYRVTAGRPLSR